MRVLVVLALLGMSSPALANHPGEQLDEVMAAKEAAFEAAESSVPELALQTSDGADLDLGELEDRIVVLSFIPDGCGSPCADQQQSLVKVQRDVNVGPMRDMVTFITVADPGDQLPQQWNSSNWVAAGPVGETVDQLAGEMAATSQRDVDIPMVHVVQRGGRQAAIFHGAEFGTTNMLLYINGLTNAHTPEPSFVDWLLGWTR